MSDTIPEGPFPSDSTGCYTCPKCHSIVSPAESQVNGQHKACALSVVESEIDVEARFEVDGHIFDCAGPIRGTRHIDYEKHTLFWRFKRLVAKWYKRVEDRDKKIEQLKAALSGITRAQAKELDRLRSGLEEAIESIPNGELSEEKNRLRRIARGELE